MPLMGRKQGKCDKCNVEDECAHVYIDLVTTYIATCRDCAPQLVLAIDIIIQRVMSDKWYARRKRQELNDARETREAILKFAEESNEPRERPRHFN